MCRLIFRDSCLFCVISNDWRQCSCIAKVSREFHKIKFIDETEIVWVSFCDTIELEYYIYRIDTNWFQWSTGKNTFVAFIELILKLSLSCDETSSWWNWFGNEMLYLSERKKAVIRGEGEINQSVITFWIYGKMKTLQVPHKIFVGIKS